MSDPAQTVTPELLPCPFCGNAPTLERWPARVFDAEPERFMVTCENEGDDAHPRCPLEGSFMEREEWNRRAPLLLSPSEREELAALLYRQHDYLGSWETVNGADRDYHLRRADEVFAAGYSKRSSPSSAGQEPLNPVEQKRRSLPLLDALADWRDYWLTAFSDDLILTGRQADELCTLLNVPYDALSAGETETRT